MLTAVLCDIDGVIRLFEPDAGLEARYGLAPGTVSAAAFAPARLQPAITGAATDEQWRAAVAGDLAAACGSPAAAGALLAEWGSPATCRVDTAVVALLSRARRHVPLALVSNATTRLEEDLAVLGLDGLADVVINSSRTGAAKPDPGIYLAAAASLRVRADRCLFVDDSAVNVQAASRLGMTGLLYRQPGDLRVALRQLPPGVRG